MLSEKAKKNGRNRGSDKKRKKYAHEVSENTVRKSKKNGWSRGCA